VTEWTVHDLRRTVATRMADLGIAPPHVIEALLNHVSGHKAGVAGIYNRSSYQREVRRGYDQPTPPGRCSRLRTGSVLYRRRF
jgi:hypothetical protein